MELTFPEFDETEIENLRACLDSGWVTQGPFVDQFEKQVAELHRVEHAMATTSCTAALHLSTLALDLGPGDEVIVPAFTWITSANCAEYVGAKTVFVDIDRDTYNMDMEALEAAINERTRAIVAVHLFGLAADMDRINALAEKHDLFVIEDAACAIGTQYKGQPIGGLGDAGCFSFHPRKVVTTGEGGMVTTNDAGLADIVHSLRNHGSTGIQNLEQPRGPWTMATFNRLGYNLRLSDIQAAVGVAQMEKFERLLKGRRDAAFQYSELLADMEEFAYPTTGADCSGHSFQSYVIRLKEGNRECRNEIMQVLADNGINTRPGTHAVPTLGYYQDKYHIKPGSFPIAEECQDMTITLPLFPRMSREDQGKVVDCLRQAVIRI